jgi:hypothetical protein
MKLIVHQTKYGMDIYEADTKAKELAAYMSMFKENTKYGVDLSELSPIEKGLYSAAIKGDCLAAKHLCHIRKDYEYEGFEFYDSIDAAKEMK